ncbi:CcmD family protein [Longimicrobium sp.]|uniref:CcmD family protein n=1 Tax=Longimicrobium sp. TaxID=2029185 RepID=UPI002D0FF4E9|nr:CcmD family protein [Longimicrobium sp.]HSU17436.1 CcmD family protein [Longimicrobium sp.]
MRPIRFARAALAAALLALSPAPRLAAQDAPPAAASTQAPAPAEQPLGGPALSAEAGPPRTLRAYWHVFIAFALAWLLVFGYAISLGRRFRAIEREVDALRGAS